MKRQYNNKMQQRERVDDFDMFCQALHSIAIPGRRVLKAGNLLAGRTIGEFKCDVGTVYSNHGMYACMWVEMQYGATYSAPSDPLIRKAVLELNDDVLTFLCRKLSVVYGTR